MDGALGSDGPARWSIGWRNVSLDGRAAQSIDEDGMSHQVRLSFKSHPQPPSNADRRLVLGINHADNMCMSERAERNVKGRSRRFGCIATAPERSAQGPGKLQARPALGPPAANPADEHATLAIFHGPEAKTAELPVTEHQGHVAQASDRVIGTPPRYFMTSASPHISAYESRSDSRNMRRIKRSVSRDSTIGLRTPGYTTDSVWLRFFNVSNAVRTLEYAPFAASPTFSRELLQSARVIRALPSATIAPRCWPRFRRRPPAQSRGRLRHERAAVPLGDHPHSQRQEGVARSAQDRIRQNRRHDLESWNSPAQRADDRREDRLDLLGQVNVLELARRRTTCPPRWHKDGSCRARSAVDGTGARSSTPSGFASTTQRRYQAGRSARWPS